MLLMVIDTEVIDSLGRQLSAIVENASYFIPEICLFSFLVIILLLDLIFKKKPAWIFTISATSGLMITFLFLLQQWTFLEPNAEGFLLFSRMIRLDRLAVYFKLLICLSAFFTVLISVYYKSGSKNIRLESLKRIGEYYTVMFGLVLGAMLLSMSTNLLMIYLSIELISISSYILTNFNFNRRSAEASIKYVLFGGVSSGLMLYGISLLYGLTGALDLTQSQFQEYVAVAPFAIVVIAGLFTLGGFLFKISSIPFHIWAPDIYEGAPTPIAAFFSIVPKAAGFAVLLRFTSFFFGSVGEAFSWQVVMAIIAIITIIIGNFAALWQKNAKRMMAYSSIAHSGFILVGVLAASELGMLSVLFYLGIYACMNLATFLMIHMVSKKSGAEEISQYKGLGLQYPFIGVLLLIAMISLTGLPPTAGFTAKLFIFSSLWSAYQDTQSTILFTLFILGLFNTVVSLFYYLKIPYYMFFKKSETSSMKGQFTKHEASGKQTQYKFHSFEKILALILIFPLLILFFKSDWLIEFIHTIPFKF